MGEIGCFFARLFFVNLEIALTSKTLQLCIVTALQEHLYLFQKRKKADIKPILQE